MIHRAVLPTTRSQEISNKFHNGRNECYVAMHGGLDNRPAEGRMGVHAGRQYDGPAGSKYHRSAANNDAGYPACQYVAQKDGELNCASRGLMAWLCEDSA